MAAALSHGIARAPPPIHAELLKACDERTTSPPNGWNRAARSHSAKV
jgi:hypothetical protein